MARPDLAVHTKLPLCRPGFTLASCIQGETRLCLVSDTILQASDLLLCWLYYIFQHEGAQQSCSTFSAARRVFT